MVKISGNLNQIRFMIVKSKISTQNDFAALRQLNPIYKKSQ